MKIARENKTIESMINIYCHDQHGKKDESCPECQELLNYARKRLERCSFQNDKPTCAKCPQIVGDWMTRNPPHHAHARTGTIESAGPETISG